MARRDHSHAAVDEIRVVGGETTVEGHELSAAAASAGVSVRWLDFASADAQAAIAAQGPGTVALPLVIVGGTYALQRPPFTAVSACLAAMHSGDTTLPARAMPLGHGRPPGRGQRGRDAKGSLWTVNGVAA
jgi:predicted alpha/beta hydrolase